MPFIYYQVLFSFQPPSNKLLTFSKVPFSINLVIVLSSREFPIQQFCNVRATSANTVPSACATKAETFSLPDLNPSFLFDHYSRNSTVQPGVKAEFCCLFFARTLLNAVYSSFGITIFGAVQRP